MGTKTLSDDVPKEMRPLPEWMGKSDLVILSFLDDHAIGDFENPPLAIARNTGVSESHTRTRVRVLENSGLLHRATDARGFYRLSDVGRRFLDDELTGEERDRLEAFDPEDI